ncbi:hypothetical protein Tco_0825092 [Tanacetum coccineum]
MDKSWMYRAPRASSQYVSGVEYFLNFAFENSSKHGMILCPCTDCHNRFHLERDKVYDHLICVGFKRGYLNWTDHGESNEVSSSSMIENDEDEDMDHEMHEILHDLFPTVSMERSMGEQERETEREREPERDFNHEKQNDKKKFDDLVKDVDQKVYPNCKHNKLSSLVRLYHIKSLCGWSNKSFSMLLEFLQEELLPHGNILPKKHHEVKNIMNKLGLGYEKIHACPNGCMLFWNENENKEVCSFCNASRWRPNQEDNSGDESGDEAGIQDGAGLQKKAGLRKKKAMNILRWFPLKPRLQRLFMSSKTAHLMKWHHLERVKDGKLRHPADALSWKHFDEKHPEFASDHRNVRLALTSDGFNPYRSMNSNYSIWPVFVIPYNLPPWYVMKQPNFILSLIISGPKSPSNKAFDVYMQPLIKELK